jgi:hypothetical protein
MQNQLIRLADCSSAGAYRLIPEPLKLLLHRACILVDRERHLGLAHRGRRDERLQERLHLEPFGTRGGRFAALGLFGPADRSRFS